METYGIVLMLSSGVNSSIEAGVSLKKKKSEIQNKIKCVLQM